MATTWADVVLIAPALSTTPLGLQAIVLADVATIVFEDTWGDQFDMATRLLCAHFGTEFARGASAANGPVIGKTVGDVSVMYGSPMRARPASEYDSTPYGRRFTSLARSLKGGTATAL